MGHLIYNMRKITQDAIHAFNNNRNFSRGNTVVRHFTCDGSTSMYLHNNLIAEKDSNGYVTIMTMGWATKTTKERLNGLDGVNIVQKFGAWYLNGVYWDGLPILLDC